MQAVHYDNNNSNNNNKAWPDACSNDKNTDEVLIMLISDLKAFILWFSVGLNITIITIINYYFFIIIIIIIIINIIIIIIIIIFII